MVNKLAASNSCSSKILQRQSVSRRNNVPYAVRCQHGVLEHTPGSFIVKVMESKIERPKVPLTSQSRRCAGCVHWIREIGQRL